MLLMVGLGNPGAKYAGNRHNIGFMAVDEIVRRHPFGPWRKRFQADVSEGFLDGEKILAIKPQTFMNESGRAVGEAMRFFQLAPADVVVLHDELDLPIARLRVKTGGGHAGHNGLRSIGAHIGADFHRVRLGIGHPGDKAAVQFFVLQDFAKSELAPVEALVEAIGRHGGLLGKRDFATFQNRVHLDLNPPAPRAAGPAAGKIGKGSD